MALQRDLLEHTQSGLTTLARAWAITRADGVSFGFTDHDLDLSFDGLLFKAASGLTAVAIEQSTGLSIDNTEALGVLSDLAVREEDILAGRFDGAEVVAWLVNWSDVSMRSVLFRGTIGEIRQANGAFRAELRGLTEGLNQQQGRIYQKPCTAVLGDGSCRFDVEASGYSLEIAVNVAEDGRVFRWPAMADFEIGWFTRGVLRVQTGAAAGLSDTIKRDVVNASGERVIELWEPIRDAVQPGDMIKLIAGCDKRFDTCRFKFNNVLNYQGFPDIPGEDWQTGYPTRRGENTGGSLR